MSLGLDQGRGGEGGVIVYMYVETPSQFYGSFHFKITVPKPRGWGAWL